jgi:hypothetical protein
VDCKCDHKVLKILLSEYWGVLSPSLVLMGKSHSSTQDDLHFRERECPQILRNESNMFDFMDKKSSLVFKMLNYETTLKLFSV